MTHTAVALRHVPFEDLGLIAPLLAERGFRVAYLDAGVDDLTDGRATDADLLVVLGGPVGVGDVTVYPFLRQETDLLAHRLGQRRPTLGICLGAQLIATALGASVRPGDSVEIGYAPLTLTDAGSRSPLAPIVDAPVLHWHRDSFDTPEGAVNLAATGHTPNQGFTIDEHVLALQFHLEVDHTQIERWLIGHAHEIVGNGIDPRTIRRDAAGHGPVLAERARAAFSSWLDGLDDAR